MHGHIILPRYMTPNWLALCLVYGGGDLPGLLLCRLELLMLERFSGAVDVNWKEMFAVPASLKTIIVDSCGVLRLLDCLQGRRCFYYKTSVGKILQRLICVVSDKKNNNKYFNQAIIRHSGPAFHTQVKILHRNDIVVEKLCEVQLPSPITHIWNRIQDYKKKIARNSVL
uniref:Disease resistance protein n=1 Tax=Strongyloides venezuelensis TaxID=75913 RepID=A0A0K0FJT0_STRVS